MFRAYGSLPPSERTSTARASGSKQEPTLLGPFDLPRWPIGPVGGQLHTENGDAIGTKPPVRRSLSLFEGDYQRQLHGSVPSASGQQQEQLNSEYNRQDNDLQRNEQTLASLLLSNERLFQPNDDPLEAMEMQHLQFIEMGTQRV
uniref:Uncharacterized protein n=1 Tax=Anopheles culicifacies TaxID=139723 RepID=A0A182MRZ0_9DIPT